MSSPKSKQNDFIKIQSFNLQKNTEGDPFVLNNYEFQCISHQIHHQKQKKVKFYNTPVDQLRIQMALMDEVLENKTPIDFSHHEKRCKHRNSLLRPVELPSVPKKYKATVEERSEEQKALQEIYSTTEI